MGGAGLYTSCEWTRTLPPAHLSRCLPHMHVSLPVLSSLQHAEAYRHKDFEGPPRLVAVAWLPCGCGNRVLGYRGALPNDRVRKLVIVTFQL